MLLKSQLLASLFECIIVFNVMPHSILPTSYYYKGEGEKRGWCQCTFSESVGFGGRLHILCLQDSCTTAIVLEVSFPVVSVSLS